MRGSSWLNADIIHGKMMARKLKYSSKHCFCTLWWGRVDRVWWKQNGRLANVIIVRSDPARLSVKRLQQPDWPRYLLTE